MLFRSIEFMNGKIVNYHSDNAGLLTELSEVTAAGPTLGGVVVQKSRGVYVGMPTISQLEVASYSLPGTLNQKNAINNSGALICWVAANAAGTRLYTSETGSGTISVYDITHPSFPNELQHFSLATGSMPVHLKLDATGKFLYVADRTSNKMHILNVSQSDGTLSETIPAISLGFPAGSIPQGMVVVSK